MVGVSSPERHPSSGNMASIFNLIDGHERVVNLTLVTLEAGSPEVTIDASVKLRDKSVGYVCVID